MAYPHLQLVEEQQSKRKAGSHSEANMQLWMQRRRRRPTEFLMSLLPSDLCIIMVACGLYHGVVESESIIS